MPIEALNELVMLNFKTILIIFGGFAIAELITRFYCGEYALKFDFAFNLVFLFLNGTVIYYMFEYNSVQTTISLAVFSIAAIQCCKLIRDILTPFADHLHARKERKRTERKHKLYERQLEIITQSKLSKEEKQRHIENVLDRMRELYK